ncbi:Glucose dehydrogenase/choline dehydrogenase/mandelonitrile lyase (GMC oxidoreductase family) [Ceraceosorus bombacis]|uniref:Glucose dehydrogenase/choline dehydrogenase/mandelonitrile lyase (GMC oxidoreductase family) n=1 Tax=Ceraceosorus bombacis TaxID=401625 RepID=A0A0P1B842_9BASI|nr:Glucose dehydrogenase/choline dehydrogenase/mandelonitrile lyase (GMC oxidoreductase family) [Ceraceosorus bombacis]
MRSSAFVGLTAFAAALVGTHTASALAIPPLTVWTADYVVVGAGTAGMTLAARLSEDPSVTVAVIEAGRDYKENVDVINESFVNVPGSDVIGVGTEETPTALDWQYYIENNPELRRTKPELPAATFDARNYGSDSTAPLFVGYPNTPQNFSKFVDLAVQECGIPRIQDFNGGKLLGGNYAAVTVDPTKGERSTSRVFYEAARNRPNFKIFLETRAKRLTFSTPAGGKPKADGVVVSSLLNGVGETGRIVAKREVILSGGSFNSPALLMVSGVGPTAELSKFDIAPVLINENVGRNLVDHVFGATITYEITPETRSYTDLAANPLFLTQQLGNFSANNLGPLTNPVADYLAWERLPPATASAIGAGVLNSYPADWPHVEYLSAPGVTGNFANLLQQNAIAGAGGKRYASILAALVAPRSIGSVNLASKDLKDLPLVDLNWFSDPVDRAVAVWAFKRLRQFFASKAMAPVLVGGVANEYLPGAKIQTDAQILEYLRSTVSTVWHAACTTRAGKTIQDSVVNSKWQVHGIDALRVVDAGSFPDLAPGHPQSVVYAIAERAARDIAAFRRAQK